MQVSGFGQGAGAGGRGDHEAGLTDDTASAHYAATSMLPTTSLRRHGNQGKIDAMAAAGEGHTLQTAARPGIGRQSNRTYSSSSKSSSR